MFEKTYYATHPDMMAGATNEQLRDRYLVEGLFADDTITLTQGINAGTGTVRLQTTLTGHIVGTGAIVAARGATGARECRRSRGGTADVSRVPVAGSAGADRESAHAGLAGGVLIRMVGAAD